MKTWTALIIFLGTAAGARAAPQGPCANFAKFAAIRAYKAEMGTVQGSNGIDYSAEMIRSDRGTTTYVVTIRDNNEDGEVWEVDYSVRVKGPNPLCKILSVKKMSAR